jgi:deoxyhypusine monooxygenase
MYTRVIEAMHVVDNNGHGYNIIVVVLLVLLASSSHCTCNQSRCCTTIAVLNQIMWDRTPPLSDLEASISDPSSPIGLRMRAAYYLKQLFVNSAESDPAIQDRVMASLSAGLKDRRHGSLMRHEYAYVLGQLRDPHGCAPLEEILAAADDCSMVRHEAAEALAAIGAPTSRRVLQQTMEASQHNTPELYETCLVALHGMDWRLHSHEEAGEEEPVGCACLTNPYSSVDPAPPHPAHATWTLEKLGSVLIDPSQSLFDRYRAMFSLRNRGGEQAVLQLCRALPLPLTRDMDNTSALLRHEVAYVLGQLQHPASVPALEQSLRNLQEHQMVRHEAAEALGAMEDAWDKVQPILHEFTKDDNPVVRESCLVALDAADYWGHNQIATTSQEDEQDGEETHRPSSFAKEKAGGVSLETDHKGSNNQDILFQHFNIKSS